MSLALKEKLLQTCDKLIVEGGTVTASAFTNNGCRWVEAEQLAKWHAGCLNLIRLLGRAGEHWLPAIDLGESRMNYAIRADHILGTMRGIREAIADGLVVRIEDLVLAEAFGNLLEQAEHLFMNGFFLPAGVLGRAVLEEHLRKWCEHASCSPTKPKPTMSDFYQSLYGAKHINKLQLKQIELIAAVGNDAAHAKDTLTRQDVERMLRELAAFLAMHPLS